MAWEHLRAQVLLYFEAAQALYEPPIATDEGGLEALRAAWRARQETRGLCRSCKTPAVPWKKSCAKHLETNRLRARRAQGLP